MLVWAQDYKHSQNAVRKTNKCKDKGHRRPQAAGVVVVAAVLVAVAWPCAAQEAASECWAAVQEEQPQPQPATEHLLRMGLFVADFAKEIEVNVVYFCVAEGTGFNQKKMQEIFTTTLVSHTIYFLPCDLAEMGRAVRALDEGTKRSIQLPLLQPAALHLTSRTALASTYASLWGELGRQDVIGGKHIIVGADLPDCDLLLDATTYWYQASYHKESGRVLAEEMYLFNDGREALRVAVASWRAPGGLTVLHQPGLGPLDFQGHVVNVVTMSDSPSVMEVSPCKKNQTEVSALASQCSTDYLMGSMAGGSGEERKAYAGFLIELLLTIGNTLNFKSQLTILPPEDAVFGADKGDGNYSGLIGVVQSWQADIALAGFSITDKRARVVDFSTPVGYSGMALFAQRNSSLEAIGWDTFVLSFHWGTWLAIVMLLGVMTVGLWVIMQHQHNENPHFLEGKNVAFILFSCLVQQGSWILPSTARAQAVLWLFWFTSVVLYASYTAILTSFLTVSTVTPPFTTMEGAVNSPGWKIGLLKGTSTPKSLERSKEPSYKKVYEGLVQDPGLYFNTRLEGIDRMLTDSKFSFFADSQPMAYLLKGNCSIKQMTGTYIAGFIHLGYRKQLPYSKVIDKELLKLESGGLLDRIHRKWWGQSIPCEAPSPYTPLGFGNILTAFLLLLAGTCLSVVILIGELAYKSHLRKVLQPLQVKDSTFKVLSSSHDGIRKLDNGVFIVRTTERRRSRQMAPYYKNK